MEISVWDDDLPWTQHGVEGKKAERKIEKSPYSFYENLSVERRPSIDNALGTKVGNFLTRVSNKIKLR
jgi:hypothetical protein